MAEQRVGTVTHYYGHIGVAIVKLENAIRTGESLVIRGAHDDIPFNLDSMQINHMDVPEASRGQEVGMKVPAKAHEGSVLFRVLPEKAPKPRAPRAAAGRARPRPRKKPAARPARRRATRPKPRRAAKKKAPRRKPARRKAPARKRRPTRRRR